MSDYFETDYASLAKLGFVAGVALFLAGAGGEVVGHTFFDVPAWGETLLLDMEIVGVLAALLSPLVFGIVMPLVE
jgi:hypothetical protein